MKLEGEINLPQELCNYSDAEYVGDNNTQKSVTWYINKIIGLVIVWRS